MKTTIRIIIAGLIGGFIGNGVLGAFFSAPPVKAMLYDPNVQSQLFIEVTATRNIPVSVMGLIVLSIIHSWLYFVLSPAIPGRNWFQKGLFWGLVIWLMFWLFQEWFIYHTLLQEPLTLNLFELSILLLGSLIEGIMIALILKDESKKK